MTPSTPARRHDSSLPSHLPFRFLVQNVLRMADETGVSFDPADVDISAADNVLDRCVCVVCVYA